MIYIGCPYSDPDPAVRATRADMVDAFAAECIKTGHVVYSPISSWHHILVKHQIPSDFQFWQHLNLQMLRYASEFWILKLHGWNKSIGLAGERDFAEDLGIPVRFFDAENFLEVT